jgi:hypothetical protein
MDQRSNILLLRIAGCMVILAAVAGLIGQLHGLPDLTGFAILTPIALFAFGIGVGSILFGIAAVLHQRQKAPGEVSTGDVAQRQLFDLTMKVEELSLAISRMTNAPNAVASSADESAGSDAPEVLVALQKLFEELRDLSLLTDEQRQQRYQEQHEKRRAMAVQEAKAHAQNRQWTETEKALAQIEKQWPGDPALAAIRGEMELAQIEAENQSLEIAQSQIETEMSLSHWDQALSLARELADQFPTSVRSVTLLNRVEREHAIYTESTVQRLFDDIRHDSERRAWRRALDHAQILLAKFPDHPRSELIRKQIKTVQDNAEIEERQEQDARISELIRARRFREAIQLSEQLLEQFPASRQAETITKLLPRIRQLAAEEEAQSAQSPAT